MNILSYSPSIEVYAVVGKDMEVVDLSPDVTQATVNRIQDGASSFTVRLQNVDRKYNGFFMPMDRIKIFCTKVERVPLLTGYITNVPSATLYGCEVSISGSCTLYRLQQLYWDTGLIESQRALGYSGNEKDWASVVVNLLTKVAGYSSDSLFIGSMPDEVIEWARDMYEAQAQDTSQFISMVDEFYDVLQTHGPQMRMGSISYDGTLVGGGISLMGDGVDFTMSESAFVNLWGTRIDKFYEWYQGTAGEKIPLLGHGKQFAKSAYIHKFDPRLSPSQSIKESGGGRFVFEPYNAWGWAVYYGGLHATSWDDAIEKHISGLVRNGYGELKTIKEIMYMYAPPSDGNNTDEYIADVEKFFAMITNF